MSQLHAWSRVTRNVHALIGWAVVSGSIGLATHSAGAQPIYVNAGATGANTGASWVNAYRDLQSALAIGEGRDVWIAAGTYYPGPGGSPGTTTFMLPSGVRLLGGFAGWEQDATRRDPTRNITTLSGDLGRDDPSTLDNASHVLVAAGTLAVAPTIDGLTITGGRGSFSGGSASGGGLLVSGVPISVRGCTFVGNTTAPRASGAGGAIALLNSPSASIVDTRFLSNSTGWDAVPSMSTEVGEAVHAFGSTVNIVRCVFIGNRPGDALGSWCDHGLVRPGSFGVPGGAIGLINSTTRIEACVFIGNAAGNGGGGAVCMVGGSPRIGPGSPGGNGAAIFSSGGVIDISSCVFDSNTTGAPGYSPQGTTPAAPGVETIDIQSLARVFACTFVNNKSPSGINLDKGLVADPTHIVWTPDDLDTPIDPRFLAPMGADGVLGTADDDFRLLSSSPYIDAGDNTRIPSGFVMDAAGLGRFADMPMVVDTGVGPAPIVDRGAYESHPALCTADFDGSGTLDVVDVIVFINAWFTQTPVADIDGGGVGVSDVFAFLNAWFAGC